MDSNKQSELDELLVALGDKALTEAQRERLEELVAGDAETRESYLDYMAVDGMLRFRSKGGDNVEVGDDWANAGRRSWPNTVAIVGVVAACLVIGFSLLKNLNWGGGHQVPIVDGARSTSRPFVVAGWNLRASQGAEYSVLGEGKVELISGELYAAPGEGVFHSPIEIQTGAGTVAASDSRFHIQTNTMNIQPITRLFVIAGAMATLTNPGGSAEAAPGEAVTAAGDEKPQKLQADGNYREAYEIYEKLVLDANHGGGDCADDLRGAFACLQKLGEIEKLDALLEGVAETHAEDWLVLKELARRYWEAPAGGVIIDNQFVRGGSGGQPVDVGERNRVRALQLIKQAMPLVPPGKGAGILTDDERVAVADYYALVAGLVQGGRQLWNLQTLTDIAKMPDLGDPVYWASNAAPPVDENETPIYYREPASWETAENDGERWRWTLKQRGSVLPDEAIGVKLEYADFLHRQFGVHTSGAIDYPFLDESELLPEGRYTTHTLSETETIARLATGVRRFDLPEGQRFIEMYREVAALPHVEPENPLRDLTYKVYHGDWDEMPDFTQLQSVAEGEIASGKFDLEVAGRRPDNFAVVFEGEIEIPETGDYTFELRSDDGSILRIGGEIVADADGCHSIRDLVSETVRLEKGRHPLRLDYFEKHSELGLAVTWKGPAEGAEYGHLSTMRFHELPQERALQQIAQIFENRRQLPKAAEIWRELIDRFGPGVNFWRRDRYEQIVNNWARLDSVKPFTAGTKATLGIQFRNATGLKLSAREVDIEKYIADAKAYLRSNPRQLGNQHHIFRVGERIVQNGMDKYLLADTVEWTRALQPAPGHWTTDAQIETPLDKAGVYLVEATANDGNTTRVLCWITNTSIVYKPGDRQHLYYVADAITGAPVAGANVEVFAYWSRHDKEAGRNQTHTINFSRNTDEEGWVSTVANDVDDNRYERIVIARDEKTGRFGILGEFFRDRLRELKDTPYVAGKAWCVSDRPVYRPGQSVHLKAWVRQARYDMDDVSLYAGREFDLVLFDPAGKEIERQKQKTDQFGGLAVDWKFGDEAMLGTYRFMVEAKNWKRPGRAKPYDKRWIGNVTFRVEEYKKPEYEVTVEAPTEPATLGDSIEATVRAKYYFGAPVTNAEVKYTVRRTNHADSWFPGGRWDWFYGPGYWWWGYDYSWYPGWSNWCLRRHGWFHSNPPEIVQENTVRIGADGTVKIKIDTSAAKERWGDSDHSYQITAEVVDESRRTITGSGSVIAARHPFNVSVWMDGGHFRPGEQMGASFSARTPDGKGVKGKGTATLYRVRFAEDGTPTETEVGRWEVETDAAGRASLAMESGAPGQYRLSYILRDAKGREREGAALTRIVGDGGAREDDGFHFDALELVLDKAEYAPGDNARLLINTDRANSTVALFIRPAASVYPKPILLTLEGKSTMVPIPIAQKDMPNIYVEAFTISNGLLYKTTREIIVPPEQRVLTLDIEPSEEKYEPGEKAKVKIRLTDADGKPFSGSTVVAIYDKSLEAIAGSQVSDIRKYFWQWRRSHAASGRFSMSHHFSRIGRTGDLVMNDIGTYWIGWGNPRRASLRGVRFRNSYGRDERGRMNFGFGKENSMRWGVVDYGVSGRSESRKNLYFDSGLGLGREEFGVNLEGMVAGEGPIAVRSNFADTALWVASVTADENGLAEVELEMPENLTTWKIKAWAVGHGTRVGHGEAEVITSKDVMVRLQAPRFFTQTDEVVLSANVHNYTGAKREFEVALEIEGGHLGLLAADTATQTIEVEADGDQRVNWKVSALTEGEALVRIKASTADGKGDAMEQRFPVLVHGILKTDSFSVALRDGEATKSFEIEVPAERRPEQTHLEVRYSPSIALSLIDALPHLAGYPYKNSESATSRFVPLVLTQKVMKDLGVDLEAVRDKAINLNPQEIGDAKERAAQWQQHHKGNPIFSNAEVDALIERSLKELTGMQNPDGGWGWYKGHDSSTHSTAYVVHGLQVAKANGAALVPDILQRGLSWLEAHQEAEVAKLQRGDKTPRIRPWKSSASNSDAFVYMVLAEAGGDQAGIGAMGEFLYRDRLRLTPYSMAMVAIAFDQFGDDEKRDMIARNLSQFLATDDENQTARLVLKNRGWSWYWYGNDIEANAYYLKLLCRSGEAKGATASGLAKYLLNNRKHATYWNSTRDTAVAIEALAEYARASGETEPDMEVEVLVDGKSLKKVKITKDNLFAFDGVLHLRAAALETGKHTVEIRRTGKGNLYTNAYLTNFTLEDFITKAGLEIKVERRYYRLEDVDLSIDAAGSRGQVVGYKVEKKKRIPLESGAQVKSGDLIEVELLIDSKNDYEYLQFSDRKPAGFEAVDTRSGHRWLGGISAYMELRDESVDFFAQRVRTGKHSLTYRLRAEIPGKFSALPASGDGVYAPELRANSDEFKVVIGER